MNQKSLKTSSWGIFTSKATKANIPLIVVERYQYNSSDGENLFFVMGNDRSGANYLRPYSDCNKGFTRKEMIQYLNERLASGWVYVGNISGEFDAMVKKICGIV